MDGGSPVLDSGAPTSDGASAPTGNASHGTSSGSSLADGGPSRAPGGSTADAIPVTGARVELDCPNDHFGSTRVDVGELKLNVACWGSGTPILMLHGYPEFHLAWSKLAAPLVAAGHRVIAPDLRGYNLSDKPEAIDAYAIDHLIADMKGLIDATLTAPVLVVAHDWGGVLAYVFAHREPARLRGMVIMNSPHPDIWGHPEVDPELARAGESYIPMIAGPLGAFVIPLVEAMLAPYLSAEEARAYRQAWDQPGAAAAMAKWYNANNYPEYKLPSNVTVTVPTLALAGLDDTFVTPSQLDALPRFVSKLKTARIEDVDHWMTHQITDDLVRRIRDFASELPPAQRSP